MVAEFQESGMRLFSGVVEMQEDVFSGAVWPSTWCLALEWMCVDVLSFRAHAYQKQLPVRSAHSTELGFV